MRNWNWEALGTIAELIAAAGVVISLIYVAAEIQQNTVQLEEATRVQRLAQLDAAFENFSRQRMLMAENADVAEIYLAGLGDPESLDPVERFRFEAMLGDFLHASQLLYARVEEGTLYPEVWQDLLWALIPMFEYPAMAAYWEETKPIYRSSFVEAVERAVEAGGTVR